MGIIPHFLLQCAFQLAFQRAFHFAFQNVFQPQPYCRLGFEKSVTPFPKSPRTHSVSEPEPQAAICILYGVPSPAPVCPLWAYARAYVCARAYMRIYARARNACVCVPMTRVPRTTSAPHAPPWHVRTSRSPDPRATRLPRATPLPRPAWRARAMPGTCRLWAWHAPDMRCATRR